MSFPADIISIGLSVQLHLYSHTIIIVVRFFDKLFGKRTAVKREEQVSKELPKQQPKYPEDDFIITITNDHVKIQHPGRKEESIYWTDIEEIRLVNTDQGPWMPDVWLALVGKETGCLVPQGAKGFEEVYDIVSKYEGFDFQKVIESMSCTDNTQFLVWKRGVKVDREA